ncbi:(d)CMP kinase [Paenibacillus sp. IB182496]|uniref:Cytidylate kinase n=1 Tax=Paenibacillus sabuli TaxID=2772509 RepID=A0A927BR27_9BACL|nr:(d)CMP kinase [Paenibacillus sabuli]MBD2845188.1 (d)CMP kinase [Paenibacillus sabuli]
MQHESGNERINIAIDGPAGAGKSTVAKKVAELLGYVYIDTGAMYRAVALAAYRSGVDAADGDRIARLLETLKIALYPGPDGQRVCIDGEDATAAIRSREVTLRVSQVASHERVRLRLVEMQRALAASKGAVMDGRDIGSHVLPHAELKVFLTASVKVRAARRFSESGAEQGVSLEQLEREIVERDRADAQRVHSPLVRASDAKLLDSTDLSIEQVVEQIVAWSRTKLAEAK